MQKTNQISPFLGRPRIYRQVSFDVETFDVLQSAKRQLSAAMGESLNNSGVLRVLLLSHPLAGADREDATDGRR